MKPTDDAEGSDRRQELLKMLDDCPPAPPTIDVHDNHITINVGADAVVTLADQVEAILGKLGIVAKRA